MRERARTFAAAIVAMVLLNAPRLAQACPMCMSGREDDTRQAFILTTLFLSVLPLGAIGGFVWWLSRRARALERESEEPAAPATGPSLSD